jgi:hypothetical protein
MDKLFFILVVFFTFVYLFFPSIEQKNIHRQKEIFIGIHVCMWNRLRLRNAKALLQNASRHGIRGELFNCSELCVSNYNFLAHFRSIMPPNSLFLWMEDDVVVENWSKIKEITQTASSLFPNLDLLSFFTSTTFETWQRFFLTSRLWHGQEIHQILPWAGYAFTLALIFTPEAIDRILASNMKETCLAGTRWPDTFFGELNKKGLLKIYRYGGPSLIIHNSDALGGSLLPRRIGEIWPAKNLV